MPGGPTSSTAAPCDSAAASGNVHPSEPAAPASPDIARGGSIHPIEHAPVTPGEDFGDVLLAPGLEYEWENGGWNAEAGGWFRRDGTQLYPTHFSPLPGKTILLRGY